MGIPMEMGLCKSVGTKFVGTSMELHISLVSKVELGLAIAASTLVATILFA
jgi:hypothetical protein